MEDFIKLIGLGIVGALFVVGIGLISVIPVTLLWNWLIPSIFGLREITYLEGFGLMMLLSFLIKSTVPTSK